MKINKGNVIRLILFLGILMEFFNSNINIAKAAVKNPMYTSIDQFYNDHNITEIYDFSKWSYVLAGKNQSGNLCVIGRNNYPFQWYSNNGLQINTTDENKIFEEVIYNNDGTINTYYSPRKSAVDFNVTGIIEFTNYDIKNQSDGTIYAAKSGDYVYGVDPEPNPYLIWAPAYDENGAFEVNMNYRVVYRTSEGSPYYLLATDLSGFFCDILSDDKVKIDSWNTEQNYYMFDTASNSWKYKGPMNELVQFKSNILATSHDIVEYGNTSNIVFHANPEAITAPEDTNLFDPGVYPTYSEKTIPKPTGFKVDIYGYMQSNDFILSWDPVFGNLYVEIQVTANVHDKTTDFFISPSVSNVKRTIVPFWNNINANLGTFNISYQDVLNAYKSEFPDKFFIVNKVSLRFVGKMLNKFYSSPWVVADLTYDTTTGKVIKNTISYTDPDGNTIDEAVYENILGEINANQWTPSQGIINKNLSDISMTDAFDVIRTSSDFVGEVPELTQKLMLFMPSDIWVLIFIGMGFLIVLRVLGR